MENKEMPGLMPALWEDLEWYAFQVTVFKHKTARGVSVKANIKGKLSSRERWDNCAFDHMVSLQGRSRNAAKAMHNLSEKCLQYGQVDVREWMLKNYQSLQDRVTEYAVVDNPGWKKSYLRTGIGRQTSKWGDRRVMQPLNPGVLACYDASTNIFGLTLGHYRRLEIVNRTLTEAQERHGVVAYSWWLTDENFCQTTENPNDRLARFRSNN